MSDLTDDRPTKYRLLFTTQMHVTIELDAEDEIEADEIAWEIAQAYANRVTPHGDHRIVNVEADFDGIGAAEIEEVSS